MKDILVTAGATRNPIDSMRYISANSSGQTGARIAEQLAKTNNVTFLGSAEAICRCPSDVTKAEFTTTIDLMSKMKEWVQTHPLGMVVHAAAVGDYMAKDLDEKQKFPSGQTEISVTLVPTHKILDLIHSWSPQATVVSFKAAKPNTTRAELESITEAQAQRTHSDAVFANVIGQIQQQVLFWHNGTVQWSEQRADGLRGLVDWIESRSR